MSKDVFQSNVGANSTSRGNKHDQIIFYDDSSAPVGVVDYLELSHAYFYTNILKSTLPLFTMGNAFFNVSF